MPLRIRTMTPRGCAPITPGKLTVLVGPNNSGKSQTLRDIRDYLVSGSLQHLTILEHIDVDLPNVDQAVSEVSIQSHQNPGNVRVHGVANDLQNRHELGIGENWVTQMYSQQPNHNAPGSAHSRGMLLRHMGTFWCGYLDAEGRFRLAAPTDSYDRRTESPGNALQKFFSGGKEAENKLRGAFRKAFGMDIALDWAAMRKLYLKVGPGFGDIPDTLEGLNSLLQEAPELSQQGDGYKSFSGIVLAMLSFPNRILLLDEPEAFLHPAQARTLGRWIAEQSAARPSQTIIASHSAAFLWGLVSQAPDATVVRLRRQKRETVYTVVGSEITAGLIASPLLSSQPVLDALFHRGVIVCEGDPDRAIYQTVLHRFFNESRGDEVLLIHSNGKDAMRSPIEMLRQAGAPVCAIVDLDVLNSSDILSGIVQALTGKEISSCLLELRKAISVAVEQATEEDLLQSMKASAETWWRQQFSSLREARRSLVAIARQKSKWDNVKAQGINYFSGEVRAIAERLVGDLAKIGLFVVPCGELEGWIPIGIAKGRRWNAAALEKLHAGECPSDLRDFVGNAARYILSE